MIRLNAFVLILCVLAGCSRDGLPSQAPAVEVPDNAKWLVTGQPDERWVKTARHLRGLDVAMWEIGQRYEELAWAGKDQNWEYAEYQLGKLWLSLDTALERRPKRAASATMFDPAVSSVRKAILAKDAAAFEQAFTQMTVMCNACHQAEQVGFMLVVAPTERRGVIRKPAAP